MQIYGTDITKKYIILRIDDKPYIIEFDYGLFKGIRNVKVYHGKRPEKIEIMSAYPGLLRVIREVALIIKINVLRQSHSR